MAFAENLNDDDLGYGSIATISVVAAFFGIGLLLCYRRANRLIQTGISLPLQDTSRPARSFRDSGSFAPSDGSSGRLLDARYADNFEINVDEEDAEELTEGGPTTWGRRRSEAYTDQDFAEEDARELGEVRREDLVIADEAAEREGFGPEDDTQLSQEAASKQSPFSLVDVEEDEPEGWAV